MWIYSDRDHPSGTALAAILAAGASKAKKHFVTAAAPLKADFPLVKPSRFEMASDVLKAMISQS
jgi:hypothetical protein